jgi:hypothetical protein
VKINWHENPLKSTVVLDENEKEIFIEKARIKELKDAAMSASFHLKDAEGKFYSPERAHSFLQHALDEEGVKERSLDMIKELETGYHCGDCTCVASGCERCLAENVLGFGTLDDLSQRGGYILDMVYGSEEDVTLEQALHKLEIEISDALEQGRSEDHADTVEVYKWLLIYKMEKLGRGISPLRT